MADAGSARGTADRNMLHRLNTETAGWSEAMVKRLTSDLRAGVRNVRMILEPRHLGRLNVELGLRNGRASIRIAAETGEAARLLSGARGQLGQMLENAGMRLAGFHASGSGGEASFDSGQGANAHAGQDGGKNAGRDKGFSNKIPTTDADLREGDSLRDGPDNALRAGETAVLSILA
jgi:flagellar hook-length control protein FliK